MSAEQTIIVRGERERQHAMKSIYEMRIDPAHPKEITIGEHKKKRSLNQNSLYWKWLSEVIEIVGKETGNDPEDLHTFFKHKYLAPHVIEINGETVLEYTTTRLTTAEMHDYMEKIYAFVTQKPWSIDLPLPEQRIAA